MTKIYTFCKKEVLDLKYFDIFFCHRVFHECVDIVCTIYLVENRSSSQERDINTARFKHNIHNDRIIEGLYVKYSCILFHRCDSCQL